MPLSPLFAAAALAFPLHPPAPPSPATTSFAQLKTLVGTWRDAGNAGSPLRIRFYLTAGNSVLVEEWTARGRQHSMTVYHRDGMALLATHYCPKGNQPRMAYQPASPGIRFTFRDATNMEHAADSHQHELAFDLSDPARPVRSEVYRSGEGDEPDRLVLERVPDTAPARP